MTRKFERYRHPSRGLPAEDVGPYLGRSPGWFFTNRPALEAAGFPHVDPVVGTYDKRAIDVWWDVKSRLDHTGADGIDWDAEADRRLEALEGGAMQGRA